MASMMMMENETKGFLCVERERKCYEDRNDQDRFSFYLHDDYLLYHLHHHHRRIYHPNVNVIVLTQLGSRLESIFLCKDNIELEEKYKLLL